MKLSNEEKRVIKKSVEASFLKQYSMSYDKSDILKIRILGDSEARVYTSDRRTYICILTPKLKDPQKGSWHVESY